MNPDFDFFSTFVQGLSSMEVIVAVIGFVSAASFAGFWATRFGHLVLPQPRESRVSDFLPFNKLMADGITIRCYNGSFARVFKVEGVDLSFVTDEKNLSMMEARKSWIDGMSDLQIVCRVITLRERIAMEEDVGNFNNPLLEQISNTWRNTLDRVYANRHYIVLSVADRPEALKDLNYASQALLATLNDYGVKPMYETEDSPAADSPLAVFAKICSPITQPAPKVRNAEGAQLNEMLTSDHIHFTGEKGIIKFFSGEKEKYEIAMGIRTSGDYMDEGMIASLLSIDCELTLLHNVKPFFKPHARALLMQQQRMAAVTSFSPDVINQYSEALSSIEDSDADYQALTEYAMTVILKGDSMEEIDFGESEVQRICRLFSVTPVREGWVTQATFFNQFPTYETYPRTYRYLSRVVAMAISFDKPSEGFAKSDWGPGAITVFRTASGSAYRFQFHVSSEDSAVAHCCIIGPTGQGKTTLLTFLAGQAMRHSDLKVFFFDRHRGAEIFTRSIGGAYVGFDGDEKGGKETEEARFARIREAVMTDLKHTFRPEFLNRIDEIIVFHQLTEENIRSIARRMLDTIGSRMAAQGITLQADDDAVAALAKDGFDPRYGARPLRRTLQTEVEDVVAEQMLDGKLQSGDTAHVRLKDDKVVIEK